jgi:uncharacterized protein YyaL (SSP411 family)
LNRLAHESSPYLLQHKDNPVDWYPWGEEALATAARDDKPLLISVGYAACHWCHVMERESFEDPETAELMNQWFVNIKVDREERPDIDSIYMTALQALSGHGGWPMTVFATPAGQPIFAGTYFPKDDRPGHPSFSRVLTSVAGAWAEQRDKLESQAVGITEAIQRAVAPSPNTELQPDLAAAYETHIGQFDETHGGFGGAPKFPQPPNLEFLLRIGSEDWARDAWPALAYTLQKMANGGIYDHVGGGFARYSVDRVWLVPHFEKMLYDNANLARLYLRAAQVTGDETFTTVAFETLDYMIRDLGLEGGGFASSEDADSEGEEGKFYVFTEEEITELAGDAAPLILRHFGVTESGNFEGRNILHRSEPLTSVAADLRIDQAEAEATVHAVRARLLEYRNQRVRPGLDDKLVVGWNGLAIRALAEAGAVANRPDYLEAARKNARFVLAELIDPSGRLHRTWRRGTLGPLAVLEDYAAYALGLFTLFQATGETEWFTHAESLTEQMIELFSDGTAFYATGVDAESLIVRPTDIMDNPSASGSSLAAEALHMSHLLTGNSSRPAQIELIVSSAVDLTRQHPTAVGHLLAVLHTLGADPLEVAVVGPDTSALEELVWSRFRPRLVLAPSRRQESGHSTQDSPVPLLRGRHSPETGGLAYVCRNFACELPVSDPTDLATLLS